MNALPSRLPDLLQQARKARRWSQLELSARVGVSQRHVSFVERGRARPSRSLLMRWLQELDAPLAARNAAMLEAGYAPAYGSATLSDPALSQASQALSRLLQAHDPLPALVIDAHWNLVQLNRGAAWLAVTLMPWAAAQLGAGPANMLDLLLHPQGMTRSIVNLPEVGPLMLSHLREAAAAQPTLATRVQAFADLLASLLGKRSLGVLPAPSAPVMTTRFESPHGELAFFSMFTTFGTPQDITLASLRVEHMFAADSATLAVIRRQVG